LLGPTHLETDLFIGRTKRLRLLHFSFFGLRTNWTNVHYLVKSLFCRKYSHLYKILIFHPSAEVVPVIVVWDAGCGKSSCLLPTQC
jgi:hypothetical protein